MAKANRYAHLLRAVEATAQNSKAGKPYRILEIGVYDGQHAKEMIQHAVKHGRSLVEYWGFDLFEDMTPEKNKEEVGKPKMAPSMAAVQKAIGGGGKVKVTLVKGDSRVTLSEQVGKLPPMDVIFVDGGHSLATIRDDYLNVKKLMHGKTVVLFDDYYAGDHTKGCAHLVDTHLSKLPGLDVQVRDPADVFPDLKVNMVWVRPAEWPLPGDQGYLIPEAHDELRPEYDLKTLKQVPSRIQAPRLKDDGSDVFKANVGKTFAAGRLRGEEPVDPRSVAHVAGASNVEDARIPEYVPPPEPQKSLSDRHIEEIQKVEDQKFLDAVNKPLPAEPKEEAVEPASGPFPPEGGGDRPDVQPDGLRGDSGEVRPADAPECAGDAGGRREPDVEPRAVEVVPEGPPADAPVREERQEPDPVVELGAKASPPAEDPVRGGDELGRQVPPPVVGGAGGGAQPGNRKSRRSGNQRPGTPPPPAGAGPR